MDPNGYKMAILLIFKRKMVNRTEYILMDINGYASNHQDKSLSFRIGREGDRFKSIQKDLPVLASTGFWLGLTLNVEVVFGHFLWTRTGLEHVDQVRRKLSDVQSAEPTQSGRRISLKARLANLTLPWSPIKWWGCGRWPWMRMWRSPCCQRPNGAWGEETP